MLFYRLRSSSLPLSTQANESLVATSTTAASLSTDPELAKAIEEEIAAQKLWNKVHLSPANAPKVSAPSPLPTRLSTPSVSSAILPPIYEGLKKQIDAHNAQLVKEREDYETALHRIRVTLHFPQRYQVRLN